MRYLIALYFAALAGCYLSHEPAPPPDYAPQDAGACPRVVPAACTFDDRYDIRPDFAQAVVRLGCGGGPRPTCHYSCDAQRAREAFTCATSCADLYAQDRQLCGP